MDEQFFRNPQHRFGYSVALSSSTETDPVSNTARIALETKEQQLRSRFSDSEAGPLGWNQFLVLRPGLAGRRFRVPPAPFLA